MLPSRTTCIKPPLRRCRFALPRRDQQLGLPIGQHISLRAADDGGPMLLRPYTPVSDKEQYGLVDFVIKVRSCRSSVADRQPPPILDDPCILPVLTAALSDPVLKQPLQALH